MSKYQVLAICNICREIHNMYIGVIRLDDVLPKRESISDTFAGKELPPSIAALSSTRFICPKAKRFTLQADNNRIFLVPFLETGKGANDSRDRSRKIINCLFRDFSHAYSGDDPPDAVKVHPHGPSKDFIDEA